MAGMIVSLLREQHGEAMKALVRNVADAVDAASCRIVLIDPESKQLVVGAAISDEDEPDAGTGGEPTEPTTVALNYQGRSLGMLTAGRKPGVDPERFRKDLDWVSDIAAQTIQVLQELAVERDERVLLESFNAIARALVAKSDEPDALTTMLDHLWRVVRYDAGAIALLDGGVLEVATARGAEPGSRVIVSDVIGLEAALRSRKPVALDTPSELLPAFGLPAGEVGILAPLVAKEIVVGAFVLAFRSKAAVGDRQARLLEKFAEHGGVFVDAERLLSRERSARIRAAALSRASRIVATNIERGDLIQTVAEYMLECSGADRAVVYEGHARNAILIPRVMAGVDPAEEERAYALRLNLEDDNLAPLIQDRVPVLLEERESIQNATPFARTTSLLLIPMFSPDVLTGAIALARLDTSTRFDDVQIELLSSVAQQFTLGLENARLLSELARMATMDEMTKLANRRSFIDVLGDWLREAASKDEPLAVLLLDMDRLKRINDTHGHATGDAAIEHVAAALRKRRSGEELPARIGGEEFAVALRGAGIDAAHEAAEKIRSGLGNSFLAEVGIVTASFGVAAFPADGTTPSELLKAADGRLYKAKAAGRNQVCSSTLPATIPPTPAEPGEQAEMPSQ